MKRNSHRNRLIERYLASSASMALMLLIPFVASGQVAGSTVIGVAATEMREVATGWSATHQILGKPVYNDQNESIGAVDDIIVAPDKQVSFAIIGAGGFLGVARHDVAIPVAQLRLRDGKLVLPGATKEALKNAPAFEYASPRSRRE